MHGFGGVAALGVHLAQGLLCLQDRCGEIVDRDPVLFGRDTEPAEGLDRDPGLIAQIRELVAELGDVV